MNLEDFRNLDPVLFLSSGRVIGKSNHSKEWFIQPQKQFNIKDPQGTFFAENLFSLNSRPSPNFNIPKVYQLRGLNSKDFQFFFPSFLPLKNLEFRIQRSINFFTKFPSSELWNSFLLKLYDPKDFNECFSWRKCELFY